MELHPIIELGTEPKADVWYVVSSPHPPCERVGQAMLCGKDHNLYIFGGADPLLAYNDFYRFDLKRHTWSKVSHRTFQERYEHCAFIPEFDGESVYMFGGADKSKNLNSVQKMHLETGEATLLNVSGEYPSPRTIHSAVSSGNCLYIWCGGHQGSNPVMDQRLHVFDAHKNSWKQPMIKGSMPSPRHGHVMSMVGNNIYIHGGMCGPTLHQDLYKINLIASSCTKLNATGELPSARAGHTAVSRETDIFIFGGLTQDGALDEMFKLDTVGLVWSKVKFDVSPPTPRLDHSMLLIDLPIVKLKTKNGDDSREKTSLSSAPTIVPLDDWSASTSGSTLGDATGDSVTSQQPQSDVEISGSVPVFIVFGGMDSLGNLYNDVSLLRLGST